MAGHDLIVVVDQNWVVEAKTFDASGDLLDLLGRVSAGIARVRVKGMSGPMFEVHKVSCHARVRDRQET
jgi:hypothetical protein